MKLFGDIVYGTSVEKVIFNLSGKLMSGKTWAKSPFIQYTHTPPHTHTHVRDRHRERKRGEKERDGERRRGMGREVPSYLGVCWATPGLVMFLILMILSPQMRGEQLNFLPYLLNPQPQKNMSNFGEERWWWRAEEEWCLQSHYSKWFVDVFEKKWIEAPQNY